MGPAEGLGSLKAGVIAGRLGMERGKEFNGPGENAQISMAALGRARCSSLMSSWITRRVFSSRVNTWYQINLWQQPGTLAKAQIADIYNPDGWHDRDQQRETDQDVHFTHSPQPGFEPNEACTSLTSGEFRRLGSGRFLCR